MVVTTGVVWAVAAAFAVVGMIGPRWMRQLGWSWGGAVLYGLGTGYMKIMTVVLKDGQVFTGPEFWAAAVGLALAYGVGGVLIQQGYASGPAEVVVGSMTTIDPLAAVVVGLVVLGEGANLTPAVGIGMALAGAVAAGGVAVLSRFHPDTQRHLAQQAAAG
jgi:drug/metabolite transporter (DMT)-like permease